MSPSLPPNLRVLSSLPSDHSGFDLSSDRFVHALHRAEEGHFWYRARNAFLARHLAFLGASPPDRILDLGCGSGCVAAHLARLGYRVTGVDGHLPLLRCAAQRAPEASFLLHDLAQGVAPLQTDGGTDIVGLFDVIEHLDDPALALRQALSLLRPGGLLVGTVPAMMALWSQVDVQAGHRLRYDPEGLHRLLASISGGWLLEILPFHRILVPMIWLQRRLVVKENDAAATSERNLAIPPAPINWALEAALRWEDALHPWLCRMPLPGASLWFALRKEPG
ncbi:MAG: class I SAM-dependent methyltransferase [Myxococcales bacterium]|nr:class I SAM-dependent methyltransferase [Polyangiaceae bacterium]MDW8249103.1 class I SAM-dependent methyltransferase [Myxococcales bacterium]